MPVDPAQTLAEADGLRHHDREHALRLYARLDPALVFEEVERREWVVDQLGSNPVEELRPFLRYGIEHGSGVDQRRCIHHLALSHWYGFEVHEARALWRRAVEIGRTERDHLWLFGIVNLSLVHTREGRVFEALPLIGLARSEAQRLGDLATVAFTAMRHGAVMVELTEWELAERSFLEAEQLLDQVSNERRRGVVTAEIHAFRARMACARHDCRRAHEETMRQIRALDALGRDAEPSLVVGAHSHRIKHAFSLARNTADRRRLLEELRAVPENYPFDERWRPIWEFDVRWAEFEFARREEQGTEALLETSRGLVEAVIPVFEGEERIERLIYLGERFEEAGAPDEARRAYRLAADTAVDRIGAMRVSLEHSADLVEPSVEDRQVFARATDRLAERYRVIADALQDLFVPGEPMHDWIIGDRETLRACGWCRRIHTNSDTWVPVSQYLPPAEASRVSHGICPECARDQSGRERTETVGV